MVDVPIYYCVVVSYIMYVNINLLKVLDAILYLLIIIKLKNSICAVNHPIKLAYKSKIT